MGKAERSPESNTWPDGTVPASYRTGNANIQSPSHQALDLAEIVLDQPLLDHLLAKKTEEEGVRLFDAVESDQLRECMEQGLTLDKAAERITKYRKAPSGDVRSTAINGEVARNLRPTTHGLLLIYPVIPTDSRWPASYDPFMGLAFSFPSSHTARAVEYRVNRVWQDTFQDSDYADGDE